MILRLFQFALVLVLLAVVAMVSALTTMHFANDELLWQR